MLLRMTSKTLSSPSSMRLAISTSPSRVSSETDPHLAQVHAHGIVALAGVAVVGGRSRTLDEGRGRNGRDFVFIDRRAVGEGGGTPEGALPALLGRW